jgi:stress-induced morphogen
MHGFRFATAVALTQIRLGPTLWVGGRLILGAREIWHADERQRHRTLDPERASGCTHLDPELAADGDHYAAEVVSEKFRGKSRVQQHQMVYEALKGNMGGALHALALQTSAPD